MFREGATQASELAALAQQEVEARCQAAQEAAEQLRQELQEARDQLAEPSAEAAELRARVDALPLDLDERLVYSIVQPARTIFGPTPPSAVYTRHMPPSPRSKIFTAYIHPNLIIDLSVASRPSRTATSLAVPSS